MMNPELESSLSDQKGQQRRARSRRSALEVRMDILTVLRDGATGPTQIMYKANLSWIAASQHLRELVEHAIVSENSLKTRVSYQLTEKGISILRSYRTVMDQFNLDDYYSRHSGL